MPISRHLRPKSGARPNSSCDQLILKPRLMPNRCRMIGRSIGAACWCGSCGNFISVQSWSFVPIVLAHAPQHHGGCCFDFVTFVSCWPRRLIHVFLWTVKVLEPWLGHFTVVANEGHGDCGYISVAQGLTNKAGNLDRTPSQRLRTYRLSFVCWQAKRWKMTQSATR